MGYRTAPMPPRWKATRRRIMRRDQGLCHVCGNAGADTVDHVVPVSDGGTDDDNNLAAIHDRNPPYCHRRKTAREGVRARQRVSRMRPATPHPGLVQ